MSFRYVDSLLIGDDVLVSERDELMPAEVKNISTLPMQGNFCYNVLTMCCMFHSFPVSLSLL